MVQQRGALFVVLIMLLTLACDVAAAGEGVDGPGGHGTEGMPSPTEEAGSAAPVDGEWPRTYLDMLVEVEELAPGFGGYFVEDGVMYVYMTEAIDTAVIEAAFSQVFSDDITVRAGEVQMVEADYTMAELYGWKLALARHMGELSNITSLGISGSDNRVTVGVDDEAHIELVRSQIEQLRVVPIEAVDVHQSGPWFGYGGPAPQAGIPDELMGYAVVDIVMPDDTPCLDGPQVWLRALDPRAEGDWAADPRDTEDSLKQLQSPLGVFHYVIVGAQMTDEQVVEGNQRRIKEENEDGCRTIWFGGPLTLQLAPQEEPAARSASSSGPTPTPVARPDSTPATPENRVVENPYEGMTHGEMEALHDQWRAEGLISHRPARGPETAGTTIDIAGRPVELPDDAYIGGLWLAYSMRGPFWEIIRGDSTLVIHKVTGEVIGIELAPGEEDAFNFAQEALQGPSLAWGVGASALLAGLGALTAAYVRRHGDD